MIVPWTRLPTLMPAECRALDETASGIVGYSTNWLPCRFRSMDATDAASRNRLLAALEPDDLRRLAPHLERVELARGTVLLEPHAELQHVWWPEDCIISLIPAMGSLDRWGASPLAASGGEARVRTFQARYYHPDIRRRRRGRHYRPRGDDRLY